MHIVSTRSILYFLGYAGLPSVHGSIRMTWPEESRKRNGRFRLFSGFWGHVEAATVEVDRVHEVLPVPEAPRRVLHPLDLGIDGFAGRVGNPMPQVRDDVDRK